MGMDDDSNRWEEALFHLNLLSLCHFSGSFVFHMNNGRISRSTMKRINDLARGYRMNETQPQEQVTCQT